MAYIQTYGRRTFSLTNPRPEDVCPRVIAHSLAGLNRFTGHGDVFYPVAQHCVLASRQVPPEFALATLLHDAEEAYVGDVSSPLKKAMREAWAAAGNEGPDPLTQVAARVARSVAEAFRLPAEVFHHPIVIEADMRMVVTERRDLLGSDVPPHEGEASGWPNVDPYFWRVMPWTIRHARANFVERLIELAPWVMEEYPQLCLPWR